MRYLLLFEGLAARPDASDAETVDYNRQWGEWMRAAGDGAPLEPRGKVVSSGAVEELQLATVDIGGFALVEVDDEAAAVELARKAPHVALGGRTIVRPVIAVG
jgi:hypothetical protein